MNRIFFPLSRQMCATNIARFEKQPDLKRFWLGALAGVMKREAAERKQKTASSKES